MKRGLIICLMMLSSFVMNAQSLDQNAKEILIEVLQDENLSNAFYQKSLINFKWDNEKFDQAKVKSDQRIEWIYQQFAKNELVIPEPIWNVQNAEVKDSRRLSCFEAFQMELEKVESLNNYLKSDQLPYDVKNLFIKLRDDIMTHSIPLFKDCE